MATTSYTFPFASTLEGWYHAQDPATSAQWTGSYGNPAGSLWAYFSTFNYTGYCTWYTASVAWGTIFPSLPDSALVTKVRMSVDTRCLERNAYMTYAQWSDTTGAIQNALVFSDYGGNHEMWAGRVAADAEGSWTSSGDSDWVDVHANSQEKTDVINVYLKSAYQAGIGGTGVFSHLADNVKIEIEYNPNYTLTCESGSYAVTGKNVALDLTVPVATGSYTATGYDVGFNLNLPLASGSYALTGQDVGIRRIMFADSGIYSLTGQFVGLRGDFILGLSQGSYTYTGYPIGISWTLIVDSGSYTTTGYDPTLLADLILGATAGSYTLTGPDTGLHFNHLLTQSTVGSYAVTPYDVDLIADRLLEPAYGSYTVTGVDIGLIADYGFGLDSGSYTVTPFSVDLLADRLLVPDWGNYAVTGQDVNTLVDRQLELGQGSYTITGQVMTPYAHRVVVPVFGNYTLTGIDQGIIFAREMLVDYGSYVLTGNDIASWPTSMLDPRYLVADLWLSFDDPADYDTSGSTRPFKFPLKIGYMYGFGSGLGGSRPSWASPAVNDREMVILDANNRVVVDTAEIEDDHETIYYRRTWTTDTEIIGWEKKRAVLLVVVRTDGQDEEKYEAVLAHNY